MAYNRRMLANISEFPKHPLPHVPQAPQLQAPQIHPPTVYVYEKERWEYRVIVRSREDPFGEKELNALGNDGWELTGIVTIRAKTRFYFKRLRS